MQFPCNPRSRRVAAGTLCGTAVLAAAAAVALAGVPAGAAPVSPAVQTGAQTAALNGVEAGRPGGAHGSRTGPAHGGWWGGPGQGAWSGGDAAHTEYFHVVSTKPQGPGTIIVTGVVNASGTEDPGRAVDHAVFSGGTFRIDHSAGQPAVHFDTKTCVGTITQQGPFQIIDTTGSMTALAGKGHYVFRALYTTATAGGHCTSTTTAYEEMIEGTATVSGQRTTGAAVSGK